MRPAVPREVEPRREHGPASAEHELPEGEPPGSAREPPHRRREDEARPLHEHGEAERQRPLHVVGAPLGAREPVEEERGDRGQHDRRAVRLELPQLEQRERREAERHEEPDGEAGVADAADERERRGEACEPREPHDDAPDHRVVAEDPHRERRHEAEDGRLHARDAGPSVRDVRARVEEVERLVGEVVGDRVRVCLAPAVLVHQREAERPRLGEEHRRREQEGGDGEPRRDAVDPAQAAEEAGVERGDPRAR